MASLEIQIFVRWVDGKSYTLDIFGNDPIAEVKQKFGEKAGIPPERVGFTFAGKKLEDGRTAASYGISRESTLTGHVLAFHSDAYDEEVTASLKRDLQGILAYKGGRLFVFIGIASYDSAHGVESIKHQQCPDRLLAWCRENDWDLTVMLIDPGFATGRDPQIYDQASQGWIAAPFHTELDGRIRWYTDAAGGGKRVVITYSTGIPEYVFGGALGGPSDLTDRMKIAGFPLNMFVSMWGKRADRCLVSGNFFKKPTEKTQYVTIGNQEAVAECGFAPNP